MFYKGIMLMKSLGIYSSPLKVKVLVTQSCPALCKSIDCSLPGSSVHGILQARIPEWVVLPSPGDLRWLQIKENKSIIPNQLFFSKNKNTVKFSLRPKSLFYNVKAPDPNKT